jgi:hypothetical protein
MHAHSFVLDWIQSSDGQASTTVLLTNYRLTQLQAHITVYVIVSSCAASY